MGRVHLQPGKELTDDGQDRGYLLSPYKMEIVQDTYEGGYVVSFPDLPSCITCADTLEGAVAAARDAKAEWLAAAQDGLGL